MTTHVCKNRLLNFSKIYKIIRERNKNMVGINQNCILGITHFNLVNLKVKKKKNSSM